MSKDVFEVRIVDDEMERCQRKRVVFWLAAILAIFLAAGVVVANAQGLEKPSFVVATSKLNGDKFWKQTVILARPMGAGHIGLVLNKPGQVKLSELFADHEPSKAVTDPVHRGGPTATNVIFALVKAEASPGAGSLEFMPGLWLAITAGTVDKIIEETPNEARYFAGYVSWKPGQLEEELERGLMIVLPADADKAMRRDTTNLYEEVAPAASGTKLQI